MKSIKITLLGLPLLLLAGSSHAQIYMCKDATGKTITSDRPIQECTGAVREFGSNGQIKRVIPAPLTAEQKKQKQIEDEKLKVEAAAAAEQRRQDRAMLTRYSNESEIDAARKRALDREQDQIKRDNAAITDAQKQLTIAQNEMASHKSKNTKPPATLLHRIETAETTVTDSQRSIKDHEEQIAQINVKFDETLKRFRELTTPTASK
jgi:chromosome segregation ATPase